jgi:hypothetical protein
MTDHIRNAGPMRASLRFGANPFQQRVPRDGGARRQVLPHARDIAS